MKNLISLLTLVLFFTVTSFAQNSLPSDLDVTEYTAEQKVEINNLLVKTQDILQNKLQRSRDDEYISKIIITNSYKFAKTYSDIMNDSNVPFKLVTSSTSFMGCWVGEAFETTGACWNKYLSKVNGADFASLR